MDHTVGGVSDLGVMGHQKHGRAILARERGEERNGFAGALGVEVRRGLVGKDQPRMARESAGDRDALALSAGELLRGSRRT